MENIAIITITRQGFDLARQLMEVLPEAHLYVTQKYVEGPMDRVIPFDGSVKILMA